MDTVWYLFVRCEVGDDHEVDQVEAGSRDAASRLFRAMHPSVMARNEWYVLSHEEMLERYATAEEIAWDREFALACA